MDNQQILEKLGTIVKSINIKAVINKNTALTGESILNSLEFMNYITRVEELFKINISDSDIVDQKLGIIINMVIHISSKINKN